MVIINVMPQFMDGLGTLEAIAADSTPWNVAVIASASSGSDALYVKALELGALDFICKPYEQATTKARIQSAIKLHRAAWFTLESDKMRMRIETQAQDLHRARYDNLTKLLNRDAFYEIAISEIRKRQPQYYELAAFDIDKFKVINDIYGASLGDVLLKAVADCARAEFEPVGGILCRLASDNFAVLYPRSYSESDKFARIRSGKASAREGLPSVVLSFGRYRISDPDMQMGAMYDRAYIAKSSIKGLYDAHTAYYTESMREAILAEQTIVNEMRAALASGQFEVWYQPQYNIATGAMIGAEALSRWRRPTGMMPPDKFICIFERNGFIYELDKYVWEQSCKKIREWIDNDASPLPISVNVSRVDMLNNAFFDDFMRIINKYEIPHNYMRIEITESSFAKPTDIVIDIVKKLRAEGILIEIDDFGSGYSSLNTLKDVPADVLKLDMRFLTTGEQTQRGGRILESIMRMAEWLSMPVIAEGVETEEQASYLRSIGCTYIQGYLYAKPMTEPEYTRLRQSGKTETEMGRLKTLATLDSVAFWNPKSLDTLIFNRYVGAACILEYSSERVLFMRVNDMFARELGGEGYTSHDVFTLKPELYITQNEREVFKNCVNTAVSTNAEVACEMCLRSLPRVQGKVYLSVALRHIAASGERHLFYATIQNNTEMRETNEQLSFLSAMAREILIETDPQKAINAALKRVMRYFGGTRAYAIEHKSRRVSYVLKDDCDAPEIRYTHEESISFWNAAFDGKDSVYIPDVSGRISRQNALFANSVVAVRLYIDGEAMGVMGVDNPSVNETHIHRFNALGDYMAVLLQKRDMNERLNNKKRRGADARAAK